MARVDIRRIRRAPWIDWSAWLAGLAVATAAMLAFRHSLDKAHVALVYLLLVLGGSARAGRALGLTLAITAFALLNFFFIPPHHTFVVAAPLDWLVLGAFLATGMVAAQLLARAQNEADAARRRAAEIDRLSALGSETLNAGRAEDALAAIAGVIRETIGAARCEVYLRDDASGAVTLGAGVGDEPPAPAEPVVLTDLRLVQWVGESSRAIVERANGATRVGAAAEAHADRWPDLAEARTLLLPLVVRGRTVGVLRVTNGGELTIDSERRRFLEAIAYYAALGTERVRLVAAAEHADALRQADQLKNAVIASVSHDLRTPLTTIKALAHDLGATGDERAMTIEEEADRLNRFVADLLDLSRLAGGGLSLQPEVNAVEDLIGAALQRVAGAVGSHSVHASLDPPDQLLLGHFDFTHSLRALVNLIENALKYAPAGTPIDLIARRSADRLELLVADRGPGVAHGERERIFEPFYRPPGAVPDAGSTGLGLSIARGLAEAQGGSVRHEPRDGGGSVFVLSLPAVDVGGVQHASATAPRSTFVKS